MLTKLYLYLHSFLLLFMISGGNLLAQHKLDLTPEFWEQIKGRGDKGNIGIYVSDDIFLELTSPASEKVKDY